MLAGAKAAAKAAGVSLALWQGGSYDLTPGMGPYRMVSIGRAFHWMDRLATLAMLRGPDAEVIAKAVAEDLRLYATDADTFEVVGRLFALGVSSGRGG